MFVLQMVWSGWRDWGVQGLRILLQLWKTHVRCPPSQSYKRRCVACYHSLDSPTVQEWPWWCSLLASRRKWGRCEVLLPKPVPCVHCVHCGGLMIQAAGCAVQWKLSDTTLQWDHHVHRLQFLLTQNINCVWYRNRLCGVVHLLHICLTLTLTVCGTETDCVVWCIYFTSVSHTDRHILYVWGRGVVVVWGFVSFCCCYFAYIGKTWNNCQHSDLPPWSAESRNKSNSVC